MEITSRSKLFDILKAYPFLEDQIIAVAPPFKNLRNPVLRRTVGQIATVERVAEIGRLDVTELVNALRRSAGQPEIGVDAPVQIRPPAVSAGDPAWTVGEPQFIVNGTALLQQGEVPVQRVNELLPQLDVEGFILLVTDFEPTPIIDAMNQARHCVYCKAHPDDATQYLTYIAR